MTQTKKNTLKEEFEKEFILTDKCPSHMSDLGYETELIERFWKFIDQAISQERKRVVEDLRSKANTFGDVNIKDILNKL